MFSSFILVRLHNDDYPTDFVYIKNNKLAIAVGTWCFLITFLFATLGIWPVDEKPGTKTFYHVLTLNIVEPLVMLLIGGILPLIAKYQRTHQNSHI